MTSITIDKRFCGPPKSGNGGYVAGLLAAHIDGDAEITLLAPPPLDQKLDIVAGEHGLELRRDETRFAVARRVDIESAEIPIVGFAEAEEAVRRAPMDKSRHPLPMCFVCGFARAEDDGLRIMPSPMPPHAGHPAGTLVTPWVPRADLAGEDGAVAAEFVWAAIDCPTGFAGMAARHLGLTGTETSLLGRMSAHIARLPRVGERCVIAAWPTGRDRRKLFANGALLGAGGEILAHARTTWLLVDRDVMLGA